MRPIRLARPIVIWVLAPALGVCAIWLVTFVGIIIGGVIESTIGPALFFEGSFLIPVVCGSPSGAIVAGFGAACGRWTKATYVAFVVHLLYFLILAWPYYNGVEPYIQGSGIFWWILIVGVSGGTAAGAVGGVWGQHRAIGHVTIAPKDPEMK